MNNHHYLKHLPNIITSLRIILAIPIIYLLLQQQYLMTLFFFLIAGISDGVDGYLAKRYHWISRLGQILDPLADKVLLVSCFLALAWLQRLPMSLVIVVIARDMVIVMGALLYHYYIEYLFIHPSIISKINTFVQIFLVVLVTLNAGIAYDLSDFVQRLVYIVFITTIWSGGDYIYRWGKRALQTKSYHQ